MFPFSLYVVTHPTHADDAQASGACAAVACLLDRVAAAIDGGARLFQYRDKQATRRAMFETATVLRHLTRAHGAVLIVNDQIDLAQAVQADGVHLGQDDLPVSVARKMLARGAIVGVSTHDVDAAIRAETDGADYVGFGPLFATATKQIARPPLGIAPLREVAARIAIPIYAIGGIRRDHLAEIIAAGATGVAAVSGIAGDVRENVAANVATWIRQLAESSTATRTHPDSLVKEGGLPEALGGASKT